MGGRTRLKRSKLSGRYANGAVTAGTEYDRRRAAEPVGEPIYGDPDPKTIRDDVRRNPAMAGHISVDPTTGAMTLRVPYAVDAGAPAELENAFVSEVEGDLSRTFETGILKWKRQINMTVDLYRSDKDAAFTLHACRAVTCNTPNVQGGWNLDEKILELAATRRQGSGTHEFLHFLGLGHQWNRTKSLMSYDANRALKFSDVERFYNEYKK